MNVFTHNDVHNPPLVIAQTQPASRGRGRYSPVYSVNINMDKVSVTYKHFGDRFNLIDH
ncbi:MAG: hypothetical protein AAFU78_17715 [Cyanobacteria bacterium J06633_2]